jgi:hypothetical protein
MDVLAISMGILQVYLIWVPILHRCGSTWGYFNQNLVNKRKYLAMEKVEYHIGVSRLHSQVPVYRKVDVFMFRRAHIYAASKELNPMHLHIMFMYHLRLLCSLNLALDFLIKKVFIYVLLVYWFSQNYFSIQCFIWQTYHLGCYFEDSHEDTFPATFFRDTLYISNVEYTTRVIELLLANTF